jgi:flagellar basal-body rod protein FlgF
VQSQAAIKGLPTRAFAVDASTHTDFTAGAMAVPGARWTWRCRAPGWIALQMPDGSEAYTRNGSFELNVNGVLQTRKGIPVQGDGGPISVPPEVKLSIGVDGTMSALPESGAQNTPSVIGRIKLVNPPSGDMVRGEDGLFRPAWRRPRADGRNREHCRHPGRQQCQCRRTDG